MTRQEKWNAVFRYAESIGLHLDGSLTDDYGQVIIYTDLWKQADGTIGEEEDPLYLPSDSVYIPDV